MEAKTGNSETGYCEACVVQDSMVKDSTVQNGAEQDGTVRDSSFCTPSMWVCGCWGLRDTLSARCSVEILSPEASRNTRKKERERGLDWDNPNFKWSLVPSSPPPSGALLLSGTDSSHFLRLSLSVWSLRLCRSVHPINIPNVALWHKPVVSVWECL